ncbi:MAG: response regulator transcription factor [Acidobacteriota bacterium]
MPTEKILIIEDDAVLRRGLKDNFEMRGYVALTAEDGQVGLDAALEHRPDLVVLDLMMPRLNGFEVCRQVRAAGLDMPIVMLTAKDQEADIVRGLNLGADDYVTKPFGIRELLARCAAFLRRRRTAPPENYVFGDFVLDLRSHRLLRSGVEVTLAPKEFRLLELFARRAGRALTRDQILEAVWGRDVLVTARSVDRCIATLRGKIEEDAGRPRWIRTVRDVGYRFEADPAADA